MTLSNQKCYFNFQTFTNRHCQNSRPNIVNEFHYYYYSFHSISLILLNSQIPLFLELLRRVNQSLLLLLPEESDHGRSIQNKAIKIA